MPEYTVSGKIEIIAGDQNLANQIIQGALVGDQIRIQVGDQNVDAQISEVNLRRLDFLPKGTWSIEVYLDPERKEDDDDEEGMIDPTVLDIGSTLG